MIEILLLSILGIAALVFSGLFIRERRHRDVGPAPDPGALTQWKRDRFSEQEREWLLAWIEAENGEWDKVREAWLDRNRVYDPEAMTDEQRTKMENELVYWARRRVANRS